ncbi:MAG: ubiG, partial [Alphaproteobacteria bacterium]|nr:ubiG [Alphaproteobacteria bacterium]
MTDASRRQGAPRPPAASIPAPVTAGAPADTIDPREAAHFGRLAADWWDPKGSSAMLHRLNPVRLGYIRDQIDQHWSGDECDRR